MHIKKICIYILTLLAGNANCQTNNIFYHEQYRPQIHFSPKEKWINDPNGMVYYKGIYHLFFQYYPDSTIWGPMHWGHTTSTDLIHWQQQPIALYPDSLGYIFSGSAVVDKKNTSGFGKNGNAPLVAIFTHHDPVGEKAGRNDFQNESLAYSLNNGKTWIKYARNPVLKNPGITDFRDPKVMWYEPQKKWVMTLATKDRITFYSSPNLKNWKRESEFGKEIGAHGGVWECPDLFSLNNNGKKIWVLIVNINPGGPNKGSATQYFVGDFDGKNFTNFNTDIKWIDYGPDEYAGITWSNTGDRKIFLGWMSNWLYANVVPTIKWRNAMTIPRELKLKQVGKDIFVTSEPVDELNKIQPNSVTLKDISVNKSFELSQKTGKIILPCRLDFSLEKIADFSIIISNNFGEQIMIGYNKNKNQYFIDRTKSGKVDFYKAFAEKHIAPRLAETNTINLSLILDVSSVELFADDGLTVMTETFFPSKPYDRVSIQSSQNGMSFKKIKYAHLNSIWH
ncbi:MAG: glycoside hydrolase family 32 protein [Chitinophagaceae bacterium]